MFPLREVLGWSRGDRLAEAEVCERYLIRLGFDLLRRCDISYRTSDSGRPRFNDRQVLPDDVVVPEGRTRDRGGDYAHVNSDA